MSGLPTAGRMAAFGGGYAFDELDKLRDARRAEGVAVLDFGVGDPTEPVPELVVDAARAALATHRRSGYPSYVGSAGLRAAAAERSLLSVLVSLTVSSASAAFKDSPARRCSW